MQLSKPGGGPGAYGGGPPPMGGGPGGGGPGGGGPGGSGGPGGLGSSLAAIAATSTALQQQLQQQPRFDHDLTTTLAAAGLSTHFGPAAGGGSGAGGGGGAVGFGGASFMLDQLNQLGL